MLCNSAPGAVGSLFSLSPSSHILCKWDLNILMRCHIMQIKIEGQQKTIELWITLAQGKRTLEKFELKKKGQCLFAFLKFSILFQKGLSIGLEKNSYYLSSFYSDSSIIILINVAPVHWEHLILKNSQKYQKVERMNTKKNPRKEGIKME